MRRQTTAAPRDLVAAGLAAPEYFSLRAALRRARSSLRRRFVAVLSSLIPRPWQAAWRAYCAPLCTLVWSYRLGRITTRIAGYCVGTVAVSILFAPLANASVGGVAMFAGFGLHDFQGFSAAGYFVSINHGGDTDIVQQFTAFIITTLFDLYRSIAILAIWAMLLTLSLEWVKWLAGPLTILGEAVSTMTKDLDIVQFMVLIAAVVIVWALITGRFATGIYDLVVSAVIAALAAGALANPVAAVLGDKGLLMSARQIGMSIAIGLAYKGKTGGDIKAAEKDLQQMLVWSMVRLPAQTISFGAPLDKTDVAQDATPGIEGKGSKEYNNALMELHKKDWKNHLQNITDGAVEISGTMTPPVLKEVRNWALKTIRDTVLPDAMQPTPVEDKPRMAIKDANPEAYAYADDPGSEQIVAMLLLLIGGIILFAFGGYLGIRIIIATVGGIIAAIAAIPAILLAIVPAWRAGFFRKVADVAMAMGQIMAAVAFLGAYMAVMRQLFQLGSKNLIQAMFLLDVVLLAGLLYFHKMMAHIRKMADQLAQNMARKPNAQPVSLKGNKPSVMSAAKSAAGSMITAAAAQKVGAALAGGKNGKNGVPGIPGKQPGKPGQQPVPGQKGVPPGAPDIGKPVPALPGAPAPDDEQTSTPSEPGRAPVAAGVPRRTSTENVEDATKKLESLSAARGRVENPPVAAGAQDKGARMLSPGVAPAQPLQDQRAVVDAIRGLGGGIEKVGVGVEKVGAGIDKVGNVVTAGTEATRSGLGALESATKEGTQKTGSGLAAIGTGLSALQVATLSNGQLAQRAASRERVVRGAGGGGDGDSRKVAADISAAAKDLRTAAVAVADGGRKVGAAAERSNRRGPSGGRPPNRR